MKINYISVKGLGPKGGGVVVEDFVTFFKGRANAVIGVNGCGKTHLLRVLAGVCGTDEATMLLRDLRVDECHIVVEDRGQKHEFKCSDGFDLEAVGEFKALLSERVNFPLTEWNRTFPSRVVDPFSARDNFIRLVGEEKLKETFRVHSTGVHNMAGDGFKRLLHIFFGDGATGVPTLLEYPDHHLDIMNKRRMLVALLRNDRQIIFSTHAPEMIPNDYADVDSCDQVVDMSRSQ